MHDMTRKSKKVRHLLSVKENPPLLFPIPHDDQSPVLFHSPQGISVAPLLKPPLLSTPMRSPDVWAWACCCWCCSPRRNTWSATPVKLLLKRVPLGGVIPGVCGVAGRRARRSASDSDGPGEVLREVALVP